MFRYLLHFAAPHRRSQGCSLLRASLGLFESCLDDNAASNQSDSMQFESFFSVLSDVGILIKQTKRSAIHRFSCSSGSTFSLSLGRQVPPQKVKMCLQRRHSALRSFLVILLAHAAKVTAIKWDKCTAFVQEQISANPNFAKNLTIFTPDSTQLNPLLTLAGCEVSIYRCSTVHEN
jgi:hypothetical protein